MEIIRFLLEFFSQFKYLSVGFKSRDGLVSGSRAAGHYPTDVMSGDLFSHKTEF